VPLSFSYLTLFTNNYRYDIFNTAISLAGGKIPDDRVIDGRDLSDLLFTDGSFSDTHANDPLHDCVYHYKGSPWEEDCSHEGCTPGIWSVRCGTYKLHYASQDYFTAATSGNATQYDPPLIFHIDRDPSEKYVGERAKRRLLLPRRLAPPRRSLSLLLSFL